MWLWAWWGTGSGFRSQADLTLSCKVWGEGYNLLLQVNLEYSFAVFRNLFMNYESVFFNLKNNTKIEHCKQANYCRRPGETEQNNKLFLKTVPEPNRGALKVQAILMPSAWAWSRENARILCVKAGQQCDKHACPAPQLDFRLAGATHAKSL